MHRRVGLKAKVFLAQSSKGLANAICTALECTGILSRVKPDSRIALKPNLTYPYHKPGITTSPDFIRETVKLLRQTTRHLAIVETDGGYGAWAASEAFRGHGLDEVSNEFGVELVNLCTEASEPISFRSHLAFQTLPLPTRLLRETDLLISIPVPKVHAMTRLTLSYKNQWGCIPDIMRLRRHYLFNDAIIAINRTLKPVVLGDGTYFLDRNGPLEGDPVRMNLVIAATSTGAFDRYVSEVMGISWRTVPHLRRAAACGDMPASLSEIEWNISPEDVRSHQFSLDRGLRNWIALAGFKSRFLTWLGYESWFGRVPVHSILYGIVGKPVKRQATPDIQ
jgi:uncharacterized protein (DUF362 family)